ncbi:MAG: transporter substrate-binding domain-containing protein [Gammaproteobacteria bacterium]
MKLPGTVIIACLLAFAGAARAGMVEDVLDRGVLRVGLSSFTPWAMRARDGEFIGFEPDVARRMAADMGVEAEIIPTAWDGIIPALLAKKFDVIIAGMSVTPQRNLQVNFSIPYAKLGLGIVANRERMGDATKPEDFNDENIVFALRRGTTPVEVVRNLMPKAQIRQFDDEAAALQEVLNGRADAWAAGAPGHTDAALDHPDKLFIPFAEYLRSDLSGIAVRKGDADGLNFVNNWIRLRTDDGFLADRRQYWFEGREWKPLVGGE